MGGQAHQVFFQDHLFLAGEAPQDFVKEAHVHLGRQLAPELLLGETGLQGVFLVIGLEGLADLLLQGPGGGREDIALVFLVVKQGLALVGQGIQQVGELGRGPGQHGGQLRAA